MDKTNTMSRFEALVSVESILVELKDANTQLIARIHPEHCGSGVQAGRKAPLAGHDLLRFDAAVSEPFSVEHVFEKLSGKIVLVRNNGHQKSGSVFFSKLKLRAVAVV